MNLRRKQQQGFTLIELILIVGLISLITAGIYISYNKKSMEANIKSQSQSLEIIESGLNSVYVNTNNYATLNNTLVESLGVVPSELRISAGVFKNLLGGGMNFIYVPQATLGFNGYTIQLNQLNSETCGKIATSEFANKAPLVRVNNTPVKSVNSSITAANVTTITAACAAGGNNNVVDFSSFPSNATNLAIPSSLPVIPKQSNSIAPVGNIVTSGPAACTGGSTWNINNSFCACPAGQIWTGSACVTVDTNAASCKPGFGWNGTACAALPATAPTFVRYGTPPAGVNPTTIVPTIVGSVTAPNAATAGNRYLPSLPVPSVDVKTAHPTASNCVANGGNWDGRICNFCPDIIGTVVKDSANNIVPLTPAPKNIKSTWDGFRCVTPTSGW